MSFFDRGNTMYVDATLGWKFPTWDSLKALFSKYMPQWPAGARSYQTEVLGDAQGAVMFFTNTPQEFGHEIRGIAVVDIRNGKFVRWVDYWDGCHFGVSATESLRTPPAQFPADFGESRVGESAAPAMTRIVGELSTDFARDNGEQAAQLFAPDAVLEDLTLRTAVVGRPVDRGLPRASFALTPLRPGRTCATSSEERPAEATGGRTRAPRPREASTRSSSIPGDRSCS